MSLKTKILVVMIICLLHNCYCEDYLKVKIEDIDIEFVNYTYIDEDTFDISLSYSSGNHNTMSMRIDIIEDLPQDIFLKVKLWGRAFGQYNLPTGISIDINICNNKLKDYFFKSIMATMGFDDDCPPKKGSYEKKDFNPEIGGFPLHVLPGFRLLLEAETYSGNIYIMKCKAYLLVV